MSYVRYLANVFSLSESSCGHFPWNWCSGVPSFVTTHFGWTDCAGMGGEGSFINRTSHLLAFILGVIYLDTGFYHSNLMALDYIFLIDV